MFFTQRFGQVIDGLEITTVFIFRIQGLKVGMTEVKPLPETLRLAIRNVFSSFFEVFEMPINALKIHKFDHACAIGKLNRKPTFVAFSNHHHAPNPAFELGRRHGLVQFVDAMKSGTIFVTKWIILD